MSNGSGSWETLENALGIVGVHAVVLHTGKVLYWCFDARAVGQLGRDNDNFQTLFNNPNLGSYQIFDPVAKTAGPVKAIGRNSFCAGQCQLPDGTILVIGGQDGAGAADVTGEWDKWFAAVFGTDNGALRDVQAYDPVADTWTRFPDLGDGRYYPTCALLHDGNAFIVGGLSNLQQWVLSGGNWCENDQWEMVLRGQPEAGPTPQKKFKSADQYPILRALPGSHKLFVHEENTTSIWDLDSESFVQGAEFSPPAHDAIGQPVGHQTYPLQTGHVLLPMREGDPARIMIVGGSTANCFDYNTQSDKPALVGAFVFDFNKTDPTASSWRLTRGAPTVGRLLADTVLLPDGTVFVVNGILGGAAAGHSDRFPTTSVAEIFDPATETFTTVAANPDPMHLRGYHSTAVLLPDARVAVAGNTDAYNPGEPNHHDDVSIQIFSPPYLFNGPRPVVTGVPATTTYGSALHLDTSGGPAVAKVTLMRPCAVTHSVDMDQRAILLVTTGGGGTVDVQVPTDPTLVPPGFYMLFFIAGDGTPSVAQWIQIDAGTPTFPTIDLGTYSGDCLIEEVFDGDVIIDKIDQHCRVTLESRHGSITIRHKVDQWSFASLKAATTVTIGQGVDQHSIVNITAGGDVMIGEKINEHSYATINTGGSVTIDQKVDNTSEAIITATGDVRIGQDVDQHSNVEINAGGNVTIHNNINQHSTANITAGGAIEIGQKVNEYCLVTLNAGTVFHMGQKFDQHTEATVVANGDVTIDEKIDQHSDVTITSNHGSIHLGQGISGNAKARLIADSGDIRIDDSVDGGCTLEWRAQHLICPHQDGTITHL